ncbi:hypothetical protein ACFX5U_12050 [Sphingobacterium sp. SG20118]|uniref:hypothetical protein n=1 Tax=Sphingobacterium sp. SG20118 TaxID=3367156 RepID=UPI0037DFC6DD
MKYISLPILFFVLTFQSCQQNTQVRQHAALDSVASPSIDSSSQGLAVGDKPSATNLSPSIFMIDTYRIFEGMEDPSKILDENWLDLYEENGHYHLAPIDYKIEDGYNECAEVETKTVVSKRNSILFLNFPFLKSGEVDHLKIIQAEVWPGESVIYNFNSQKYQLKGYGDITSTQVQTNDKGHEEIFHDVKNYKLTYSHNESTEANMLQVEQFNDTFIKTLFVGDIDRDGKLDFIISDPTDYEENSIRLILSSQINNNDIEKSSFQQNVQFDC